MSGKGRVSGPRTRDDAVEPTDWGMVTRPILDEPIVVEDVPSTQTTITVVPCVFAAVQLLAANPDRLGFTIRNGSTTCWLYVKAHAGGATVSDTFHTVLIGPCGYYEDPFHYVGVVTGVWTGTLADGSAFVTEYLP